LAVPPPGGGVAYGSGASRFAGSTYDPTSHYRAVAVFEFFRQQQLTPLALRRISQRQVGFLAYGFDDLDLDPALIRRPDVPLDTLAGFLALESPKAAHLCRELRRRQVFTDHRGDLLRLGPAPYLSDRQLQDGLDALAEVVRAS
jgi:kynureninase